MSVCKGVCMGTVVGCGLHGNNRCLFVRVGCGLHGNSRCLFVRVSTWLWSAWEQSLSVCKGVYLVVVCMGTIVVCL